MRRGHWCQVGW